MSVKKICGICGLPIRRGHGIHHHHTWEHKQCAAREALVEGTSSSFCRKQNERGKRDKCDRWIEDFFLEVQRDIQGFEVGRW